MVKFNRRRFIKSCAYLTILSFLPIPKKLLSVTERDDTAFVQRCIDNGKSIPCGEYRINNLLFKRGGILRLDKGVFRVEVLKND